MATKIPPMPQKTPLIDDKGIITLPWVKFLQALLDRLQSNQEDIEEIQGGP